MIRIKLFGKELLWTDLLIWSIPGTAMFLWFGWWAILIAIITGFLGALGGQFGHSWRVYGIPAVLTGPILWNSPFPHLWPAICGIPIGIFCSQGYGLPDPPDRPNPDAGSPIGRFWMRVFDRPSRQENEFLATVASRATIIGGILISMSPWIILLFQK